MATTAIRYPRARAAITTLVRLAGGFGTGLLALPLAVVVIVVALTCLIGVGVLILPAVLRAVRALADLERSRLSRGGPEVVGPGPLPSSLRAVVADRALHRDLAWLAVHATMGLAVSTVALTVVGKAVQDLTMPLWWSLVPEGQAAASVWTWTVRDWPSAFAVSLLGVAWAVAAVVLAPKLNAVLERGGRRLLAPPPGTDLSLRVGELTATRAAALDAHAAELRRIERSLHDGSQNRLVAVTVLLGAARRALARDPVTADEILERAQGAAELALAELRTVLRGVLPPVLADRGLAGALSGLAADSAVPCAVDVELDGRCAASVESTAYFAVAEALTNTARHSGATRAAITVRRRRGRLVVRVEDDGQGGAHEDGGTGLSGIRRRVRAHDGMMTMRSPPGGPTSMDVELPCGS